MDTPGVNWDMTTNNRNSEVFVANIDGTNAVNISNNIAFDGWPVWIDDETVIFSSNRGGIPYIGQLFAAKADGSGTIEITPKGESFIKPSVSPDRIFIYAQHNFEQKDYEFGCFDSSRYFVLLPGRIHCNSRSLLEAIAKTDVSRHSVSSRSYI